MTLENVLEELKRQRAMREEEAHARMVRYNVVQENYLEAIQEVYKWKRQAERYKAERDAMMDLARSSDGGERYIMAAYRASAGMI